MRRRHLLLTAVVVAGVAAPNASAAWQAPVNGAVLASFDYHRGAPFERAARRGVRFAARSGETVRASCSGKVTFAGATPAGRVISIRCGSLIATHLGLASLRVAAQERVRAGAGIATAGGNRIGLGARRANDRWAYIDPLALIPTRAPDLGPAPAPGGIARPRLAPTAVRVLEPTRATQAARDTPLVAWAALALMAASLGGMAGGLVSSVRRRWRPSTSLRRSTM